MKVPQSFEDLFPVLHATGVLQEIKPESLSKHIVNTVGDLRSVNLMVLSCCDGHQFMHVTERTRFCCDEAKRTLGVEGVTNDCFHWRTENGGPFVLSVPGLGIRRYRGETDHVDRNVLASMEEGMSLKKINVALLIGHTVCGKVKDTFGSLHEYSLYMARAKERLMKEFDMPSTNVITWLQAHREDGRHMYHVDFPRALQAVA